MYPVYLLGNFFMIINSFYIFRLYHLGVKIYLKKEMNHAKAMLIDDTEGVVGSQNIDQLSFEHNLETGVFFREENMVRDLKEIIDNWKQTSDVFESSSKRISSFDYLLSPLIRILQLIV